MIGGIGENMGGEMGGKTGEKLGEGRYKGEREMVIYKIRSPRQDA